MTLTFYGFFEGCGLLFGEDHELVDGAQLVRWIGGGLQDYGFVLPSVEVQHVRQVHASAKSSSKSPMSHQSFLVNLTCISVKIWQRNDDVAYRVRCHIKQQSKYHRVHSEYRFLGERICLPTQGKVGVRRETLFSSPHKLTEYNFIHREGFIADESTWYQATKKSISHAP